MPPNGCTWSSPRSPPASESSSANWAPPSLLGDFRARRPGVTVTIRHAGGSSAMANQVREGRLDLAFVALPGRSWPGVTLTPLTSELIALLVPAGHPLATRSDVELADLQDETLVDLPPGWGTRMAVDRAFAAAGAQRADNHRPRHLIAAPLWLGCEWPKA